MLSIKDHIVNDTTIKDTIVQRQHTKVTFNNFLGLFSDPKLVFDNTSTSIELSIK
jgi:hypothetical protein